MKTLIFLITVAFLLSCCDVKHRFNDVKQLNDIIKNSKPPILVVGKYTNIYGQHKYTIKDGNGFYYETDFMSIVLPDTLKK